MERDGVQDDMSLGSTLGQSDSRAPREIKAKYCWRPALGKPLSKRQREIALLLGQGETLSEIAGQLGICYGSVKNHVNNALLKTGLRSSHALAAWYRREAMEFGLPSCDSPRMTSFE